MKLTHLLVLAAACLLLLAIIVVEAQIDTADATRSDQGGAPTLAEPTFPPPLPGVE